MESGKKRTLADAILVARTEGFKRAMLDLPEITIRYAKGIREYAHIAQGEDLPQQRPVRVYYVWGDSGCGKSWWANLLYDTPENTYSTTDMPDKIWMGSYAGQRTLVLHEFTGLCNASIFKCMIEGYKMEFQTKGGFVWSQWDTVIITSNMEPSLLYDPQINWWSVLPTPPGPFQRRFATGGIYKGTGNFEMGTATFDNPLPIRDRDEVTEIIQTPPSPPMPDILPRSRPDATARPDEPPVDLTMISTEPSTPDTTALVDQLMNGSLNVDDFLDF